MEASGKPLELPSAVSNPVSDIGRERVSQQQIVLRRLIGITGILVVAPLLILLRSSMLPPGELPFDSISITFRNFAGAYSDPATLRLFLNTLVYAGGSVFFGLVGAGVLAWLVERTDLPFRTTIKVLMFANMTIPPLAYAFGW